MICIKHVFSTLFVFLFLIAHSQENNPGYTVEDYFTSQEVKAMVDQNKQFLLQKFPEFTAQVSNIVNAVSGNTMTAQAAKEAIDQLTASYLSQYMVNLDENENRLFSGEFQSVLIENEFVDQEIDEEWEDDGEYVDDWNPDWETTDDFNFEFPKSPMAKARSFFSKFYLAFGFHTWIESNSLMPAPTPELELWKGGFTEFGWLGSSRLGKPSSRFFVNYGISMVWNRARWDNSLMLTTETPTGFVNVFAIENFKHTNLRTRYFTAMTGFSYVSSGKRSFRIDLNGFAGLRYRTSQSIRTEGSGTKSVLTTRNKYGVNDFSYGICPAIGFQNFSIYARYDLSGLFKNSNGYDYQPFSIGIRI